MLAGCPHLVVTGLREALVPSDTIPLRLVFERAGTVDLDVPVATPNSPLPREQVPGFDPHGGGGGAGHGETSGGTSGGSHRETSGGSHGESHGDSSHG
jgi:hypothetical protein